MEETKRDIKTSHPRILAFSFSELLKYALSRNSVGVVRMSYSDLPFGSLEILRKEGIPDYENYVYRLYANGLGDLEALCPKQKKEEVRDSTTANYVFVYMHTSVLEDFAKKCIEKVTNKKMKIIWIKSNHFGMVKKFADVC